MIKGILELREVLQRSNEEKLCDLCDRESFWSRHTSGIKKILVQNPDLDINYCDDMGMTALHYAILNKYYKAIDLLLKHNADPSFLDKKGFSPLEYVFKLRHKYGRQSSKKMLLQLIRAGAQANILTLKRIVRKYGFNKKIILALLTEERTHLGHNDGHMVDDQILKRMSNVKEVLGEDSVPKKVVELLFIFHPDSNEYSSQRVKYGADDDFGIDLSFIKSESTGYLDEVSQESVEINLNRT